MGSAKPCCSGFVLVAPLSAHPRLCKGAHEFAQMLGVKFTPSVGILMGVWLGASHMRECLGLITCRLYAQLVPASRLQAGPVDLGLL